MIKAEKRLQHAAYWRMATVETEPPIAPCSGGQVVEIGLLVYRPIETGTAADGALKTMRSISSAVKAISNTSG